MLTEKNGRASSSSQTKHIKIRYFLIQDRIEKEDIGLEYCHTENMVADFMKKTLQGEKFFEFRYRIMGMSNGENITEMRKVRDEIAQNEDTQNGQTAKGIESKQFEQESSVFVSKITEPEGVCWKSEENVYRFEVLRDEEDVIEWHTWWDNVTQTIVAVINNRRTVITNPHTKCRREYHIKLKWSPLIKY